MKSIFQSRTFWLNAVSGLAMFLSGQQVLNIIPQKDTAYVAAVVFGLNIILRFITTEPVGLTNTQ